MTIGTTAMLIFIALLLGYCVLLYNGLVTLKHNVRRAWANIDVLLKQRHDELPKLVEICRQYMQHEHDTLVQVAHARAAVFGDRARMAATTWRCSLIGSCSNSGTAASCQNGANSSPRIRWIACARRWFPLAEATTR